MKLFYINYIYKNNKSRIIYDSALKKFILFINY